MKFVPYLLLILSFCVAVSLNRLPLSISGVDSKPRLIPPPQDIKSFSLGYHEVMADSLWLRWIQNFDACGKPKIARDVFENSTESFKTNDNLIDQKLGFNRSEREVCNKGWSYEMLRAIADLAPRFRMTYAVGAPSLSVIGEDHEGARLIFDRGLQEFPKDWRILYRAAYHYLFELDDMQTAAELLTQAGQNGAPVWVSSLASRLYSRLGKLKIGLAALVEYSSSVTDPEIKSEVSERIQQLRKQIKAAEKASEGLSR